MPTTVRNPTNIAIPIVASDGRNERHTTLLSRQTFNVPEGYFISDQTKGRFPQLIIKEDKPKEVIPEVVEKPKEVQAVPDAEERKTAAVQQPEMVVKPTDKTLTRGGK